MFYDLPNYGSLKTNNQTKNVRGETTEIGGHLEGSIET